MLPITPIVLSQPLQTTLAAAGPSLLSVFTDILQYRQAAQQLALEEKRLDAEFKLRSQQLTADHQQKLAQLQLLRERCERHYRLLAQESAQQHQVGMEILRQRGELIQVLVSPGFSTEDRAQILCVIQDMNEQLRGLNEASVERLALTPQVTLG
ncbi:MAG: hypothetical protein CMI09_08130 [Oceanospirillaceae bacterium]|nr:hypothetical protein [Oceanospirillaceae bacterium]